MFVFKNKVYKFKTDIRGDFQIKNLLMAFLAANVCGVKVENIIKIIHKIKSPPGRLERVKKIELLRFKKNSRRSYRYLPKSR